MAITQVQGRRAGTEVAVEDTVRVTPSVCHSESHYYEQLQRTNKKEDRDGRVLRGEP